MRKVLIPAVLGVAVFGCGVLLGCLVQTRPPYRPGGLALVKAIQEDDQRRAQELAHFWWVPILEDEKHLHIGSRFYLPIHVAAGYGRVAILEALIREHADVDARDNAGWTPVIWTFYGSSVGREAERLECLRVLARSRANLDAQDGGARHTALHLAADQGNVAFVRELVKLGANVRARCYDGSTPLHLACKAFLPKHAPEPAEIIKVLIKAGADVQAKNDAGQTAEDVAREKGREQVATLLREAGGNKPRKGPARQP